jgi:hypothetical protein
MLQNRELHDILCMSKQAIFTAIMYVAYLFVVWFLLLLQQRNLEEALAAPALNCIPPQLRNVGAPSNNDVDVVTDLHIGLPGTVRSSNRDSG